ncbi:MAG: hypothetical protein ACE5HI_11075 [bacterium]
MILKNDPILEQELVLIYIENKPAFFARVEKIVADVKPKWWRIKLLLLTYPVKIVTWIIDDEQIRGADFTMGGTPFRIEKVVVLKNLEPHTPDFDDSSTVKDSKKRQSQKACVLSLHGNKKL